MTRTKTKTRWIAFVLAVLMLFGVMPSGVFATSIGDGSKSATVSLGNRKYYLTTTAGTVLGASVYQYTTNDGITGPAFCLNHGLDYTSRRLPITGKYAASPQAAGVVANGYPQHSLDIFLSLYLDDNSILNGLTEDEYAYATQIALWASLGQLAIDGTGFSSGRERIAQPTGDTQQMRVFLAAQLLLGVAATWDRIYQTGMYICAEDGRLGPNVEIPADMTLDFAANNERYGFRRETINGVSYYTREYTFCSATSTYYSDYSIELWVGGAPSGTIYTDLDNNELPRGTFRETATWSLPTTRKSTTLNENGYEYSARAKLCIPTATAPNSGEITLRCGAYVMQYELYLAHNDVSYEQSYIIADPSKGTQTSNGVLSWGSEVTETGSLQVTKVGGTGIPLAGASFTLLGSDGSRRTGTSNADGIVLWERLDPNYTYVLSEEEAPAGYALVDPINVTIEAARVNYVTVQDSTLRHLIIRKIDKQNGSSLMGAVIAFEQIDGDFYTTAKTDHAGLIQMDADQLPVGSYRCYEVSPPEGYELSEEVQTVHWDGKRDVTLTFKDARSTTLILYKCDEKTNYGLSHAVIDVFQDGSFLTSVETNDEGIAYVHGVKEGYVTCVESVAPAGYELSEKVYGIHIDPYDPTISDDPRIAIPNKAIPTLRIVKLERGSLKPIAGITVEIWQDGVSQGKYQTDANGEIFWTGTGTILVQEVESDDEHILCSDPQQIELKAGDGIKEITLFNSKRPTVTLYKTNSVTGDPLENVPFKFEWAGSKNAAGGLRDLGTYRTDADGKIELLVEDGWLKITELESPTGFAIKDSAVQESFIEAGQDKVFRFENTPLSAICVWKYDDVDGTPVQATFQIRYLSGNESGTGGTVIGTFKTSAQNGSFTVTGLKAGTYIIEELASDSNHVVSSAPQTVYISGKDQDVVSAYFGNVPKGNLLVCKVSTGADKAPLSDTEFLVTTSDGSVVGLANGHYKTDSAGCFLVENIAPGTTLIVKELRAKDGFLLDDTPQSAVIQPGRTVSLEFHNQPIGSLTILKRSGADKKTPLQGVQFELRYADGSFVDADGGRRSSNGIYYTDERGMIQLPVTGTVVATELASIDGYTIDENTRTQTVTVRPDDNQTLYFYNNPVGGLLLTKVNEADRSQRIPNTTFEIHKLDGALVSTITTGENGTVFVPLTDGGYYAVETVAGSVGGKHFVVDPAPIYFEVKDGKQTSKTVTNKAFCGILIHKVDADTGRGIYGVSFLLYDGNHNPIGQYESDQNGDVLIDGLTEAGRYYLRELSAEGYVVDTQLKTVNVQSGQTTEITWKNTAIRGQIQIVKKSADDNPINALPKGTLLEGAVFEIYDRAGNVVDTVKTDSRGRAVSRLLPLSRYTVREVSAPQFYAVNPTVFNAYLEYEGQIVSFEVEDESVATGVSIKKTGYAEVMPGQPIRYTITGVANTSTVPLGSFYWRDALPPQVTLDKVVTGTYNQQLAYKVVYKTNLSGESYRTLADNLSTAKNYVLEARPAALGLAANERVTEIMFVFGTVKEGFAEVETAYIYGTVNSGLSNGASIVNVADAGGLYNGQWIMAVSRWLTTVYAKTTIKLPKTGY